MTEVIKKVKGFVNKKGDKFELEPSTHTHTCSEILELDEKIQKYDSNIESLSSEKMNKVLTASEGHVAVFNNEGQVIDGGDALEMDKISKNNSQGQKCTVECYISDSPNISLKIENRGSNKVCDINQSNIDNLKRALSDPSTTPENDDTKLITSKAVYNSLDGKAAASHTHSSSESWLSTLLAGKASQSDMNKVMAKIVFTALPNPDEVTTGTRVLNLGDNDHQIGNTYKCVQISNDFYADVYLKVEAQQFDQEAEDIETYAKTERTISGKGKFICLSLTKTQRPSDDEFLFKMRLFPTSTTLDVQEFAEAVISHLEANCQMGSYHFDSQIEQGSETFYHKKVWEPVYATIAALEVLKARVAELEEGANS